MATAAAATKTPVNVIETTLAGVEREREKVAAERDRLRGEADSKDQEVKTADSVVQAARSSLSLNGSGGEVAAIDHRYLSEKMIERGRAAISKLPAQFTVRQLGKKMGCSEASARKVIDAFLVGGLLVLGPRRVPDGNTSAQVAQHYSTKEAAGDLSDLNGETPSPATDETTAVAVDDSKPPWLRDLVQPVADERPRLEAELREREAAVQEKKNEIKAAERMSLAAGFAPRESAANGKPKAKAQKAPVRKVTEPVLARAWEAVLAVAADGPFTVRHVGEAARPKLDNSTAKAALETFRAEGEVLLIGEDVAKDSDRKAAHYELATEVD